MVGCDLRSKHLSTLWHKKHAICLLLFGLYMLSLLRHTLQMCRPPHALL
jgi:hypothetical protein